MINFLNDLGAKAHRTASSKGFTDTPFATHIALIHSEVSEAFEEYRNGVIINSLAFENAEKPIGIPSELADVIIRVLHLCAQFNIDIDTVVDAKMAYNETRSRMHGGKLV